MTRVRQAAADLNYVPQATARSLRYQRSQTLGLMLSRMPVSARLPIFQEIVVTAIAAAQARGYYIVPFVEPDDGDLHDLDYAHQALRDVEMAGIVCEYTERNALAGQAFAEAGIPVVWMLPDRPQAGLPGHGTVAIDQHRGVRQMLRTVRGDRPGEIGLIQGPGRRVARFEPIRQDSDIPFVEVDAASWQAADGYEATRSLLLAHPEVSFVFLASDVLAEGALRAISEQEMRVPDDISVVGFGDYELAETLTPSLSTVHWPLRELTETAITLLVGALSGEPTTRSLVLPTEFVARETT